MKLLIVDLEMLPMLSYHWGRWKENLSLDQTIHESYLASYAAKWYGQDEIIYDGLNSYTMSLEDEVNVATTLWKLMNQADGVVTFNGDGFDLKIMNTVWAKYGMKPPAPYASVDLIKVLKKQFRLSSNSLKSAAKFFKLDAKLTTDGWKQWIACVNKDPQAWAKMEEYNKQDIVVTEQLMQRLMPWIHNMPNHGLYQDESVPTCPTCGSTDLQQPSGPVYTATGKYKRFRCNDCGSNSRGRFTLLDADQRDVVLVGV